MNTNPIKTDKTSKHEITSTHQAQVKHVMTKPYTFRMIKRLKNAVPDPIKSKIRVVEATNGWMAFNGVVIGTTKNLITGESFVTQATEELPYIASIWIMTILFQFVVLHCEYEEHDIINQLVLGRIAMICMVFLMLSA